MEIPMRLKRIIINEITEHQYVELKEIDGPRRFTIVIGIFEATSIDRRVRKKSSPRPLTHDLLVNTIEKLKGTLRDILISELREHTYYAKLRVQLNGALVEIDSRPSDALAIAVTAGVPIFVSKDVLDEVGSD